MKWKSYKTKRDIKSLFNIAVVILWKYSHISYAYFYFIFHYAKLRFLRFFIKKRSSSTKFIIINLTEHMGDIVACEPVSRYIKEKYPQSYVIWSVRKPYRELIDSNPFIDKTLVILCLTEWILLSKTLLFDEIVDLHFSGRGCHICKIPLIKKSGRSDITLDNYYNFGNVITSFSQSAGLKISNGQPQVYISEQIKNKIDSLELPKSFISLHGSSNEISRNWTEHKWLSFLENIFCRTQLHAVEIGGKSSLSNYHHHRYINLCGKTSILETAEIIRRSKLFIGIDSGPAHLANAVGTYGIILLGHYKEFTYYMPYSGRFENLAKATVIHENGPAANIEVNKVIKIIDELRLN